MSCDEWKDIEGYEGLYIVSRKGVVKNKRTGKIKIPQERPNGYLFVALFKNGIGKCINIHRMVAKAFVENPYGLPIVNHIDEDKKNNDASILEWCTHSYNSTYGNARRCDISRRKPVVQIAKDGKEVARFESVTEAAMAINGKNARPYISSVCHGRNSSAYGFYWRFLNE